MIYLPFQRPCAVNHLGWLRPFQGIVLEIILSEEIGPG